ncbi:hypothetical protein ABIA52_000113 [Paenarthrobacter histidinolovorans]|uniref:Uncharacterized protein n=1 Tax=Paenarthrobacter histidinolovorans TaxID=43664 RepID=A0ABW8MZP5_9MICC
MKAKGFRSNDSNAFNSCFGVIDSNSSIDSKDFKDCLDTIDCNAINDSKDSKVTL